MNVKKILVLTLVILGVLFLIAAPFIIYYSLHKKSTPDSVVTEPSTTGVVLKKKMVWGATIRPYATGNATNLEQQFKLLAELFPEKACVRANVEKDMAVNDKLVALKEKYNMQLYFILEENIDFNQDADYEVKAKAFAQKIVERYKDRVEYYQLINEVSGVLYSKDDEQGDKIDAGYGLKMNKARYKNVQKYTKILSREIRRIDPKAKIIITGHWVLVNPIIKLILSGVDVDIIGWNWGSSGGEKLGIISIDNYGTLDIAKKAKYMGKKFWIIEANKDDGSYGGKEMEQALFIKNLATSARDAKNIQGYLHFILTDTQEGGPAGALGLVGITQNGSAWNYSPKKPAFSALQKVVAGN